MEGEVIGGREEWEGREGRGEGEGWRERGVEGEGSGERGD